MIDRMLASYLQKINVNVQMIIAMLVFLLLPSSAWAIDSYRFLHVTIDTPWAIFVFLFFMVFAPMILMMILHWREALSKRKDDKDETSTESEKEQ